MTTTSDVISPGTMVRLGMALNGVEPHGDRAALGDGTVTLPRRSTVLVIGITSWLGDGRSTLVLPSGELRGILRVPGRALDPCLPSDTVHSPQQHARKGDGR